MDDSLKQRLVGAAVLVALAVIFVPMVLDGPEPATAPAPSTIAAVPSGASMFRYDLNAALPSAGSTVPAVTPATTAVPAAVSKPATTVAVPAPMPGPKVADSTKPAGAPPATNAGWAAQVGSFSKQATADGVANDLKSKGFKAFVMPHKDGAQTLYRVRVGPVASRDAADALAKKITAKTGQAARPVQHP